MMSIACNHSNLHHHMNHKNSDILHKIPYSNLRSNIFHKDNRGSKTLDPLYECLDLDRIRYKLKVHHHYILYTNNGIYCIIRLLDFHNILIFEKKKIDKIFLFLL
jgi:hypothetical protein